MRCGASIDPLVRANLLGVANAGTTEGMARRKQSPELSTITRGQTVAYCRKQKPDGRDEPDTAPTDADVVKGARATMKIPQQTNGHGETVIPETPTMKLEIE